MARKIFKPVFSRPRETRVLSGPGRLAGSPPSLYSKSESVVSTAVRSERLQAQCVHVQVVGGGHRNDFIYTFFSPHQQSVLQGTAPCNTDCWCGEKKVLAMNTQQEPTLISSIFFPPAFVNSQIAQVNRPKILE